MTTQFASLFANNSSVALVIVAITVVVIVVLLVLAGLHTLATRKDESNNKGMSEKGGVEALLAVVLFVLVGFGILYITVLKPAQDAIVTTITTIP